MPRKNNRNSYNYRNIERDVRDIQRAGKRFKKSWINADGPLERILILLVVVAVIGVTIGMLLPKVNPTVGEITGEYTATGTAAETLEKLTVDDNPSKAGYDRDAFGFRETDRSDHPIRTWSENVFGGADRSCGRVGKCVAVGREHVGSCEAVPIRQRHVQSAGRGWARESAEGFRFGRILAADEQ